MRLWEKRNALCDNLEIHFALSAVVELHKPFDSGVCGCEIDSPKISYSYPCPTIQAIEKELS